ncbi:MAG: ComEC/Rec2 family competence protein [Acidobacteriota bacterium]
MRIYHNRELVIGRIFLSIRLRVSLIGLAALVLALLIACQPDQPDSQPQSDAPALQFDGKLQIHVLDVGQGDSTLIITPEGKNILIDAGTAEAGKRVIKMLKRFKVNRIDLAVATHPHADHIGGMRDVLDVVPVRAFLDSGQPYTTATYARMLSAIKDKIGELTIARAGQEFEFDSNVMLRVLGPSEPLLKDVRGSDENANSVVLLLIYNKFRMLFTGDSEEETEARLLELSADLRAEVLKVAHHGSKYATREEFLQRVKPKAATISCGADNDYGHPAPSTLTRLKKFGVDLHRTDLEGDITIVSDGSDYQIITEHPPNGSLWQGRNPTKSQTDSRSRRSR